MLELLFELTHNCPFECPHCSSIRYKNLHLKESFILNTIESFSKKYDELEIKFSGGEPLFWKFDIIHMLNCARQFNHKITLLTTGTPKQTLKNRHYPAFYMQEVINSVDAVATTLFGNEVTHGNMVAPNNPVLGKIAFFNNNQLFDLCRILNKEMIVHVIPLKSSILELESFMEMTRKPSDNRVFNNYFPVKFRGLKILPHGRSNIHIPVHEQLDLLVQLPRIKLSHSFFGKCDIENKYVFLPNGRLVHCASNKCDDKGCINRRCDLFL